MKQLIKQNYIQPAVDTQLLKNIFHKKDKKQSLLTLIPYAIISALLLGFLYELFILHISYIDIIISSVNSLPYLLVIFLNIVLGIGIFIYKNIVIILLATILFQISSLSITMNKHRLKF